MKRNYTLVFVAAAVFAVASLYNFIEGFTSRGIIGLLAAISFLLAGIHYKRSSRNKNL
ncbi:MAG TPA: hypothetical protein VFS22_01515 [Flavisolibacter sp.]|nr:hypothetical protein [Flavisolibacter sp.]